jgi:hypothetical protein
MWLLYTNAPKTRMQARSWEWEHVRKNAAHGNRTVDERLWWAFRSKKKAEAMKEWLRHHNVGMGMRVTLKQVSKIPDGWE